MKKIIITIIFLTSAICYGQKKKPVIDTLPVKDTSTYVLFGKFDDFNFLYKALTSPRDITPNQLDALVAWIRQIKQLKKP